MSNDANHHPRLEAVPDFELRAIQRRTTRAWPTVPVRAPSHSLDELDFGEINIEPDDEKLGLAKICPPATKYERISGSHGSGSHHGPNTWLAASGRTCVAPRGPGHEQTAA